MQSAFIKKFKRAVRPYDPPARFVLAYYKFWRAKLYLFRYAHFRDDVRKLREELRNSTLPARTCFLFSTRNRARWSKQSLDSMDQSGGFDVIWFDASSDPEALDLFRNYTPKHFRIVGRLGDVRHSEVAIMLALTMFTQSPYEFVGLTENDILYKGDWLPTLLKLFEIDTSETGNPTVGAASLRNFRDRNFEVKDGFSYSWNLGAGMILFRREAAVWALKDYGVVSSQPLRKFYLKKFNKDIAVAHDPFSPDITRRNVPLSCDTRYCLSVWKYGYSCIASIPSLAHDMDVHDMDAKAAADMYY
jgi:hypothetical protein